MKFQSILTTENKKLRAICRKCNIQYFKIIETNVTIFLHINSDDVRLEEIALTLCGVY